MAGVECMTEIQCIPGSSDVPADIYIYNGPEGVPVAVDTCVATPFLVSRKHSENFPCDVQTRDLHKKSRIAQN